MFGGAELRRLRILHLPFRPRREQQRVLVDRRAIVDGHVQVFRAFAAQSGHQVVDAKRRADPADQVGPALLDGGRVGAAPIYREIHHGAGLDVLAIFLDQAHLGRCGRLAGVARALHRHFPVWLGEHVEAERTQVQAAERLNMGDEGIDLARARWIDIVGQAFGADGGDVLRKLAGPDHADHRQPLDAGIAFVEPERTDKGAEIVAVNIHRAEQGCRHTTLYLGIGFHTHFDPPSRLPDLEIKLALPRALQLVHRDIPGAVGCPQRQRKYRQPQQQRKARTRQFQGRGAVGATAGGKWH